MEEIAKARWEKLKEAAKSKMKLDDLLCLEVKKKRRSKRRSVWDVTNGIHPWLIKRPSIILPEDIEKIKLVKNPMKDLNLSDSEDEEATEGATKEKENASQVQYLKICNKNNVIPVSTFYKQLPEKSVVLKNRRFLGKEFKTCVIALFCNETVTHLDIEGDDIGPTGMAYLSDLIYHTDLLVELNLTKNNIGTEGLMLLEEAMDKNYRLLSLNLSDNDIKDSDCEIIKDIMQGDNLLQSLNLSHNRIGSSGGEYIAVGLAKNNELKFLNLSWNIIRGVGAAAIGYAISRNTDLQNLNISWNGFELAGAHGIAHGLSENSTLIELDISANRINQTALSKFLKGLNLNTTLQALKITDNPIGVPGASLVLQMSEKHDSLSYLDFGNQPVTKEFEQKVSTIRKNKKIVVLFGKVISNHQKRHDGDDTMCIEGDPRVILLEFARVTKKHILDMFREFDVDGSHSITWDEFRIGIKQQNLPIRATDIEKIIQSIDIDMDGEVSFSELVIAQKAHRSKVEKLTAKGEEVFKSSTIGNINTNLRKWIADNPAKS